MWKMTFNEALQPEIQMIAYKTPLLIGTLCLICAKPVWADDDEFRDGNRSQWSLELSVGVENEPVYTGSDTYVSEADINLEVSYTTRASHEYFISLGEVGARWSLGDDRSLSTVLEYEFGRDNSEDNALTNFPTVEDTVELQALFQQQTGPVTFGVGLQYDIRNKGKGTVGFLGVAHQRELSERLGFQIQIDTSFADATHMQTEVGITRETALATSYDAYLPDSGYKGASLSLGLQYAITSKFLLSSKVAVEHYGTIMSDSPLIADAGTRTTYESSIALSYLYK